MFALYDTRDGSDFLKIESPWHKWIEDEGISSYSGSSSHDYGKWIERHIHNMIKKYIEVNKRFKPMQ